jgi:hypothetical protein
MGNCIWTQAEVVRRTGASSGLVYRIIQHLISQGGFSPKPSIVAGEHLFAMHKFT